jgi:hypothetical protein
MNKNLLISLCAVLFLWGQASPVFGGAAADGTRTRFVQTMPSVLELFRDYAGERSSRAFTELVNLYSPMGFAQDPASALTDGSEVLQLRFVATPDRKDVSDLVLSGARILTADRDQESSNAWVITVLPTAGAASATLSVPQNDVLMVFPLTVAPPTDVDLDRNGTVTEADFALYLSDPGTMRPPRFDLNRDGMRDFRDDYIFTVNYLVSLRREAAKASPAVPPASDVKDDAEIPGQPSSPPEENLHPPDDDMPSSTQ